MSLDEWNAFDKYGKKGVTYTAFQIGYSQFKLEN